jgi:hypothetical protein
MTIITTFLPFLLLFAALIRHALRGVIDYYPLPGGAPVAIAFAAVGFFATAATIVLSTIPAPDDTNPALSIAKVLLSTLLVILSGIVVFTIGRRKSLTR